MDQFNNEWEDCRECENCRECEECRECEICEEHKHHVICCMCPTGATGPTGPTGATGATGPASGCTSTGQLVVNGDMENISDEQPTDWTFVNPTGIISTDAQGRVHSGNWAVNISNESAIAQTITVTQGGCYYLFSFFARGEGSQVGLTATVTFETLSGPVTGGTITVRQQDIANSNREWTFYQLITEQSPEDTTAITIEFLVNSTGGQSLDLDDVSLIVA